MKKLMNTKDGKFLLGVAAITAVMLIGCLGPFSIYTKHILLQTVFYAYMATVWNLMCGYTGRMSLGHSAYIAIGAYTSLILFRNHGLTPWVGMILGGILAMGLMFLIAFPCFRFGLKGPYFTLASIAVMEITRYLLTHMRDLTMGSLGMSLPYKKTNFALFQFDAKEPYYLIAIAFWLVAVILLWRMERTRYYLEAIREDDDAAAALGISVNKNLIKAALLSAFLAALGGTFYVQYYRYIDPMTICGPTMATNVALMTIIGGSATILGPTIGAALVFPLSEILRSNLGDKLSGMHLFIYGVLLIVMIIYMPKGVISIPGILRKKRESMASLWGATSVDYIVDQADYVKEVLGKDISELKVAIIHEDGSYGTAVGQGNNARALEAGMNVVVYEPYSSSTLDLSSVIMKLIAADPDVLLLTGYVNDGSLFLKQSQELGFTVPILVTHSGGHSVQAFVDAIGDQVNYLLTVDPVACNPKLDSFDADLQAAFKDFEARWTEKYGVAPAHHVEMRAFAQSYLFFTEVAPKAIEEGGDFTAETVRDAILSLELDASKNLMGSDVKFSTVDEPFTDPVQGNQHVGQNIHAGAFINQYFDGELYCVWPEAYAQKEGVLFLPSSSTLSAGVAG